MTLCPTDHYPDPVTLICKKCHSSCSTCVGGSDDQCLTCKQSTSLKLLTKQDGRDYGSCVETCSNFYFQYEIGGSQDDECKKCDSSCGQCSGTGPSKCTSCTGDKFLSLSLAQLQANYLSLLTQEVPSIEGSCGDCNLMTHFELAIEGNPKLCIPCSYTQENRGVQYCSRCKYNQDKDADVECFECESGKYLFEEENRCVDVSGCPRGMYADLTSKKCLICGDKCA